GTSRRNARNSFSSSSSCSSGTSSGSFTLNSSGSNSGGLAIGAAASVRLLASASLGGLVSFGSGVVPLRLFSASLQVRFVVGPFLMWEGCPQKGEHALPLMENGV